MNSDHSAELVGRKCRLRWYCLWAGLKLDGDSRVVWEQLQTHYAEPWRAYHNLAHVEDCLEIASAHEPLFDDAPAADLAFYFHDTIYVVGASDNEEQSARWAVQVLTPPGLSSERMERVASLIRATDHRTPIVESDAALVCDVDLSILGRAPDMYDRYAAAIETEVAARREIYVPARCAFLEMMLCKPRIFHSDEFRVRYESAARDNMRRELSVWRGRPR